MLAEDEKRIGTGHFALGDNRCLRGTGASDIHLDDMMAEATVEFEGTVIVKAGDLVL